MGSQDEAGDCSAGLGVLRGRFAGFALFLRTGFFAVGMVEAEGAIEACVSVEACGSVCEAPVACGVFDDSFAGGTGTSASPVAAGTAAGSRAGSIVSVAPRAAPDSASPSRPGDRVIQTIPPMISETATTATSHGRRDVTLVCGVTHAIGVPDASTGDDSPAPASGPLVIALARAFMSGDDFGS